MFQYRGIGRGLACVRIVTAGIRDRICTYAQAYICESNMTSGTNTSTLTDMIEL